MSIAYYNGNFSRVSEVRIPLTDRSLFFGDGIYEAILARNGIMHFEDRHIERFFTNLKILGIPFDMSEEKLHSLLTYAVRLSEEGEAFVYFQLTKHAERRIHACPKTNKYNLLITVTEQKKPCPKKRLKLVSYPDLRYYYCNVKTLNLLPAVIASEYAERNGADEAVFHRGETVTECAHSNISIIKDGILYTHPKSELILPGITRGALLEEAARLGIARREEPFSRDMLYRADAVLITSSTKVCMLAESIDGVPYDRKCEIAETLCENLHNNFLLSTD